ncbi:hypothetical protein Z517_02158 [Fonsecaea pedrosoi CBS 271.37]|uniref:CFEM domain-containing protein n=1 Tax=Fonsecaea pedrosoi CBS 271.37 TaxID=1442368 RepID=A0A0D2GWB6_9EURO|nr:uncharacterized protein Z517_02158 [Fonsecaea pedrosoi CBS 271.37]KIW82915.1 hypothetical protein Z517_02158 [Fonsecaea pedrosoi CBS 271.37]
MAFTLSALLCSLLLVVSPFVSAYYERWTALPYCAQDCFTKAVNASLSTCAHTSLDCFCRNVDAVTKFDLCLQANVPCNSNPFNRDIETFKNAVFCNASVDSGFDYTLINGARTITLGRGPWGGYWTLSTSPSSWTSNTSITGTDPGSVTVTATQVIITSTSTVVVDLPPNTTSSGNLSSPWTVYSTPSAMAVQSFNAAVRAHAGTLEIVEKGLGVLVTWILVGKIF